MPATLTSKKHVEKLVEAIRMNISDNGEIPSWLLRSTQDVLDKCLSGPRPKEGLIIHFFYRLGLYAPEVRHLFIDPREGTHGESFHLRR